jgi:hypothetical protein
MSKTGYTVNSTDLIYIFQAKKSGTIPNTGYRTSDNIDLATIFQPWDGQSIRGPPTNYTVNGTDLNSIFQYIQTDNYYIDYNPFSASTNKTGYYYAIFNTNESFTITQPITGVNGILVGGGGGGGAGLGYQGGGAGGAVVTFSNLTFPTGTYNVRIGQGGNGGIYTRNDFNGSSGKKGSSTNLTGPSGSGISFTATGGGGGEGSEVSYAGRGGTNGSNPPYGTGGSIITRFDNIQSVSEIYQGDGQDGYLYTFQDETGTTFYFGGGGGGGGRNSQSTVLQNPYFGGGGFVGTRNGTTFTATTGGCGGNGYWGITAGESGFNFSFNNQNYSVGSGGGAGGNSSDNHYTNGGRGGNGIFIFYYKETIDSSSGGSSGGSSTTTSNRPTYVIPGIIG